jgi:hypothetical protein
MSIYYITPIIGAGTRADPFRTAMDSHTRTFSAIIPSNSVTGAPLFTWALVVVPDTISAGELAAIAADATIDKLPITTLDVTLGSLTNQQRNTFQTLGTKYGVTAVAGLTNQNTCRDALIAFGRKLDPNFDPSAFATA